MSAKKTKTFSFYLEGNGGGDYIRITPTDEDGVVHLEVGHCCVIRLNAYVPVEFLTAVFADYDSRDKIKQKLIDTWQYKNVGKHLAEKVLPGSRWHIVSEGKNV